MKRKGGFFCEESLFDNADTKKRRSVYDSLIQQFHDNDDNHDAQDRIWNDIINMFDNRPPIFDINLTNDMILRRYFINSIHRMIAIDGYMNAFSVYRLMYLQAYVVPHGNVTIHDAELKLNVCVKNARIHFKNNIYQIALLLKRLGIRQHIFKTFIYAHLYIHHHVQIEARGKMITRILTGIDM